MQQKPHKKIAEQIQLLKDRGLHIEDEVYAANMLKHLNYYRLSGYSLTLRKNDKFYGDASFDGIMQIYNFDKELRALLLQYLEDIEISLRTHIGYILGRQDTGSNEKLSYMNKANFVSDAHFEEICQELKSSKANGKNEPFVKHHMSQYGGVMPIWALVETFSFGTASRFFSALDSAIQKEICVEGFKGIRAAIMINMLESLVVLRNVCAHHSRLYNRGLTYNPKLSSKDHDYCLEQGYESNQIGAKLFFRIVLIDRISPDPDLSNRLIRDIRSLKEKYPFPKLSHYGFKDNWEEILLAINADYKQG